MLIVNDGGRREHTITGAPRSDLVGAALVVATVATSDVGLVPAPVAFLLTALALRRTDAPLSIPFRLGLAINILFGIALVGMMWLVLYDTWIAPA